MASFLRYRGTDSSTSGDSHDDEENAEADDLRDHGDDDDTIGVRSATADSPVPRGVDGTFLGSQRERRKRAGPNFNIIEATCLESPSCGSPADDKCTAMFKCSDHGGTQCQQ